MATIENLKELCAREKGFAAFSQPWTVNLVRCGEYVVATDGHALLAVKSDDPAIKESKPGTKKVKPFVYGDEGKETLPFAPFRKWLGLDIKADKTCPSCGHVHKCNVEEEIDGNAVIFGQYIDRSIVRKFLRHVSGDTFRVFRIYNSPEDQRLIFSGDGWRAVVMGLRNKPKMELPEYPAKKAKVDGEA